MKFLFAYERVHLFGLKDDKIDYTPKKRKDKNKSKDKKTGDDGSVSDEDDDDDDDIDENSLSTTEPARAVSLPSTPPNDTKQPHDTQKKVTNSNESQSAETKQNTSSLFTQVAKSATAIDATGKSDTERATHKQKPIHSTRSVTAAQNNVNPFQLTSQTRDYTKTPIPLVSTRVMSNKDYFLFKGIQRELRWSLRNPFDVHVDTVLNIFLAKSCDLSSHSLRDNTLMSGLFPLLTQLLDVFLKECIRLLPTSSSLSFSRRKRFLLNLPHISPHSHLMKLIQIVRNLSLVPENQKLIGLNSSLVTVLLRYIFEYHLNSFHSSLSFSADNSNQQNNNNNNDTFNWRIDDEEESEREDTFLNVLETLSLVAHYLHLREGTPYRHHLLSFIALIFTYLQQMNRIVSYCPDIKNINLFKMSQSAQSTYCDTVERGDYTPVLEQYVFHSLEFLSRLTVNPENRMFLQLFEENTKNTPFQLRLHSFDCSLTQSEQSQQPQQSPLQTNQTPVCNSSNFQPHDTTAINNNNINNANFSNNLTNGQKRPSHSFSFFLSLCENLILLASEETFQPMIVNILFNLTPNLSHCSIVTYLCNRLTQTIPFLLHILRNRPELETKVATILYMFSLFNETADVLAQYESQFVALIVGDDFRPYSKLTTDLITAIINNMNQ